MVMEAGGSVLVNGATARMNSEPMKVKILRGFYHKGEALPVGAIVDLPASLATEMITYRKCVVVEAEEEPKRKAKKEKSDAE
jgi:hypothetical protein